MGYNINYTCREDIQVDSDTRDRRRGNYRCREKESRAVALAVAWHDMDIDGLASRVSLWSTCINLHSNPTRHGRGVCAGPSSVLISRLMLKGHMADSRTLS